MAKVENVANYILGLSNPDIGDIISNLALQKLLYYCQGFYLALHDKSLFDEPILAWAYGPVVNSIYEKYRYLGANHIEKPVDIEDFELTEAEKAIISEVHEIYGQFSAWRLMEMTHQEMPWKSTPQNGIIEVRKLKTYFKTQLVVDGQE